MPDTPDRPSDLSRIFDEFLVRRQRGESPILDEYCQRFPDLAEQLRQHVRLYDALGEAGSELGVGGSGGDLLDLVAPAPNATDPAIDFGAADPRVQRLLDELLDSHATPEEVCRSCPELLPQVRARWREMCRARAELDAVFAPMLASDSNTPAPSPGVPLLPVIPGYEVEAVLGVGGMGVVFRARHLRLNRLVALKMALAGAYAGPHERERFQREAEAVAALRHPNVVQIHDVGDSDGRPYFTMEYVEGGSLAQKLAGTPQPALEAASLLAKLAAAVHAAHRVGIVHRDLKPANVLLAADGTPKVGDFGLARRVDGGGEELTRTGTAVGTPSYMAPEQARGESDAAGPQADLYALGAILYELLTGRPPFRGETAADTVHQLLTQDPVHPSRLNGKVPRDLETICLKCLRKEPGLRYATAAELADDLGRFQGGEAIAARPEGPLARTARRLRRRPALWAAVAASTLFALALAGVGLWLIFDGAATARSGDEDLRDVARRLQKSSWPEASAALQRARARLGGRASSGQRRLMDQAASEMELADRLDAIRLSLSDVVEGGIDYGRCDRAYEEALRGIAPRGVQDDPKAVADRVRESNIREALVATLDHWSSVARGQPRRDWILAVARHSDQDPEAARRSDPGPTGWRIKARDPAARADQAALARLLETAPVAEQPVSLLLSLAAGPMPLTGGQRVTFLQRVQQSHPDDFWANLTLGYVLMLQHEPAEAIRFYQAAAAIRPRVAVGHYSIGMALLRLSRSGQSGRFADAAPQFRRAAEIDPKFVSAHDHLAHSLTAMGRHAEAMEAIRRVLELAPDAPRAHARLGICLEAEGRPAEAEAAHRRAFGLDPADGEISKTLRAFLVKRGRLEDARAVWAKALETNPADHAHWYGYAELCLFLGHEGEYRRARRALLAKFGARTDPHVAERTGRACLLMPVSGDDLRKAAALATAADRARYELAYPSFRFVKGLADYREGRFDQTVAAMKGDAARVPGPAPRLVLAMALHRQGKTEEARRQLAAAVLSHDWRSTGVSDQDGCIFHVLRREAEGLILPGLPAFLAGKHRPADNVERLALLGACQFTMRECAAAGLYADAFATDPRLAEDFRSGRRASAARHAALAGCGLGEDAAKLGTAERSRLRAQAREWLRADLAAWTKAVGENPAVREAARQRLTQWRVEPDFAGLREPAELEKLPAGERAGCVAFWVEVQILFDRCGKVR